MIQTTSTDLTLETIDVATRQIITANAGPTVLRVGGTTEGFIIGDYVTIVNTGTFPITITPLALSAPTSNSTHAFPTFGQIGDPGIVPPLSISNVYYRGQYHPQGALGVSESAWEVQTPVVSAPSVSTLESLTDVVFGYPPSAGNYLAFDGSAWAALTPPTPSYKPRPYDVVLLGEGWQNGSYTVGSAADHNYYFRSTSATPFVVDVLPDGTWVTGTQQWFEGSNSPGNPIAMPIGGFMKIGCLGAGSVTITPGAGVTINTSSSLTLTVPGTIVTLVKVDIDTWDML